MRKFFIRFLINIQRKARKKSLREAIAKAKKINEETDKKVLIYFIEGQYEVFTKQEIKKHKKAGHFRGYTVQELEQGCEVKIESYVKQTKEAVA